jgi:small nuclear ribonucleoprotein (snRNP)-like protein
MKIERPLDMLNELKGKKIKVIFKSKEEIVGTLLAWDIYINLVLDNAEKSDTGMIFIRGDEVSAVCPVEI